MLILRYLIIFLTVSTSVFATDNASYKIYISQTIEHPALDATTQGIIDGLAKISTINSRKLDVQVKSAQGNIGIAQQIASQYLSEKPDIVVGVGTLSAQSFAKAAALGKTKLVFSTVTDPVAAGLVESLEKPNRGSSGVSNFVELQPQIELFKKLLPKMKTLGIIYNPGEANSVSLVEKLKSVCAKNGIKLETQVASKTSEASLATSALTKNVDAIFISNDNTALAALPTIIKVSNKSNIPVFVSDIDAVSLGAMAALGPSQYDIGKQTAKMIERILKGANINNEPVEFPKKTELKMGLQAK